MHHAPNSSTGAARLAAILMRLPVLIELVAAIRFAVGRDRRARRLDGRLRIVATALVALEMLGDPVVARFVAAGQRMALAARVAFVFHVKINEAKAADVPRAGPRIGPRQARERPPDKCPAALSTWSAAGGLQPGRHSKAFFVAVISESPDGPIRLEITYAFISRTDLTDLSAEP
jgi:hypothetical protein